MKQLDYTPYAITSKRKVRILYHTHANGFINIQPFIAPLDRKWISYNR